MSEYTPFFPESASDDDEESSVEKKDKKDSPDKKPSVFEKPKEEKKKTPELFKAEKEEIPLEKPAEDEKRHIGIAVAKGLKEDNTADLMLAPEDSAEEQEALVGATFAEALEEELSEGVPLEEAIENAAEKTQEIAELEDIDAEDVPEQTDSDDEDDDTSTTTSQNSSSTSNLLSNVKPLISPVPPTPRTPIPPIPPVLPVPPIPSVPPRPPIPPGPGPVSPLPPHPNFNTLNITPNTTPNVAPNTPPQVIEVRNRRRERTNLLLGGIIGYMIGRRGGRIRTEKKLLPIQEKLEKQVKTLEQTILLREEKLRKAARERYEQNPDSAKKTVERMQELHVLKQAERPVPVDRNIETIKQPKSVQNPEKLGKFALFVERPVVRINTPEALKSVDTMTLPELLAVATKIEVQQSTAKKLFEAGRLNDEGLRRLVRGYLRGERLENILRENLRSPEAANTPETIQQPKVEENSSGITSSNVADLLEQHLQNPTMPYEQYILPANYQASHGQKPTAQKTKKATVSAAAVGIVIGLLLLLFVLR